MILLDLFHNFRENSSAAWNLTLKENLERYLKGTHNRIKNVLRKMDSASLSYIRGLTTIKDESWEMDLSNLSEIDKCLLNIGIIVPLTKKKGEGLFTNKVSFTSNVIFHFVFQTVWPQRKSLPIQDVTDPLSLLTYALQNITPATIMDTRVGNLHGPSEKAFQAAVFCALNGLLPASMNCLFEVKIRAHEALDLMVIKDNKNWGGYEFEVEKISAAGFKDPLEQAERYAEYFDMRIDLVNFYHDGGSTPTIINVPKKVTLVNVKYNAECTKFTVYTTDNEISINVS